MPAQPRQILLTSLLALALIYAFFAGLHTVARADLGWQLATGRWIVQNHRVPSTDVFSHTANGHEWIYPPLSSVILYAIERLGGFAALSLLGALASLLTVAILLRRANVATIVLAIVAIPVIAARTAPRAEMFTLSLFAAFLAILCHHGRERAQLWALPLLMLAWVNLHPGFVAGLALLVAYSFVEFGDALADPGSSAPMIDRFRRALPWVGATFIVTLANPWGWRIYRAIAEQERALRQHALWFAEWTPLRLNAVTLRQALWVRDSQGAIFWLLIASLLAVLLYIWQRRFGSALVLAIAGWMTLQHVRYDALFACLVVVIGAPAFSQASESLACRFAKPDDDPRQQTLRFPALAALLAVVLILVGIRAYDLASNRAYLSKMEGPLFGMGLSSTYPKAAADFVLQHHLPREILNDYSTGGYWLWAIGTEYRDYVDGRALPFGPEIIQRADDLLGRIPPDSPAWDEEAHERNIRTVVVGLGLSNFAQLPAFCHSQNWMPVYLDAWAAIFVRRDEHVDSVQIDCATTPIVTAADARPNNPGERFYALVSGARVLQLLGRNQEALDRIREAQSIFRGNADVEMQRGIVLYGLQRVPEAEQALRHAVDIRPTSQNCAILGQFYGVQKRIHAAIEAYRCAAMLAPYPGRIYVLLAQLQLQANDPRAALDELDRARRHAAEADAQQSHRFQADVAEFRARAYWQMQDTAAALNAQRQAAELDSGNPIRWQHLGDLYEALGRKDDAAQAHQHAQQLSH
jgi:tetratricopeptide (TPR) repeat protein